MDALHLLRPYWLCALVPIAVLWWWYGRPRQRGSAWNRVMSPAFVRLLLSHGARGRWLADPRHLLALACAIAVIAVAGPVWQRAPHGVFRSRAALVIALDLSQSMLAQDVTPSRLKRARLKILDLLSLRQRGDTALVAYAAGAYAVTPLTYDVRTIANLVPALNPTIMPRQGANPRAALELSARLIHSGERHGGDVLLVTDGLSGESADRLAAFATRQGLRVSVLAVATAHPTPIPNLDGLGTLHVQGRPVTSALDAAPLKRLARATGGEYQPVRRDSRDIGQLQALFATRHSGNSAVAGRAAEQWHDVGPWLLLFLCVPATVYLFRRNMLFLLAVCLLVPMAQSHAGGWNELFRNGNQRGLAAYQRGDYRSAGKLFSDPRWRAAAAYRQGDLKAALSLYAGRTDIASVYDRGNVLVKLGRFQQALAAYNDVLARDPGNRDAAYNKAQVLRLLDALKHRQASGRPGHHSGKAGHAPKTDDRAESRNDRKPSTTRPQAKPGQSNPTADRKKANRSLEPMAESGHRHDKNNASLDATQARKQGQREAAQYRLRQIPDDPSGLLRRKFLYEYERRHGRVHGEQSP